MLKVLIEEVCHRRSVPQAASYGSITVVLQKLGIPTEIGTTFSINDNPIDAMAEGDEVHIMPGVDKTRADYRTAAFFVALSSRAIARRMEWSLWSRLIACQVTRGKSKSMTTEQSSPQVHGATMDARARTNTADQSSP
jgi:hypothetical protein